MNLNRKTFLKLAGAAAAAGFAPRSARAAADDPYRGLKVGIHTYTLREFSFEECLIVTSRLGLKHIGLNPKHFPILSAPEEIERRRKAIAAAGLELMALGVVGFGAKDPEPRRIFEFAKAAGFQTISAAPEEKTLDLLDPLVEEYGIPIAIHNHGPKDKWPTPDKLLAAIKNHHEKIGACVDMGHYQRAGADPAEAIRLLGSRVYDVHLKDVDKAEEKGKSVVMGTGVVDVKAALKALLDVGFKGHAAIEYEADAKAPVPGVDKSLAHIRECLAGLG